jgi:hypothetical protein
VRLKVALLLQTLDRLLAKLLLVIRASLHGGLFYQAGWRFGS